MQNVVTFRTCDKSKIFFDRLVEGARGLEIHFSRRYTTSANYSRVECERKRLALISVTGTRHEARLGFDILREAVTVCPVGIVFDFTGYGTCIEHRDFPFRLVRFGIMVGEGNFDIAKAHCLVARDQRPILPIRQSDWEKADLTDVVEKLRSITRSHSRVTSI